jgi:ribonuclease P protein subunit RPR2
MIKRQKRLEKKIAAERINILIRKARKIMIEDYDTAKRYVFLANKISKRYRVRVPEELRILFCKKCYYPYRSDRFRVRVRKSRVITSCLNCGKERRIPISPRRGEKLK